MGLPVWNNNALLSLGIFYGHIQDINIYVEDENSELFYSEFFNTIIDKSIKIKKIIPLKGRKFVIEKSKEYNQEKPALFIIDADLNLAYGEKISGYDRLFEHDKYCIENYLFSEEGLTEIIYENLANKPKKDIQKDIDWKSTINNIEETLVELFIEFAIINKINKSNKSIKTVKIGVTDLFYAKSKTETLICKEKTAKLIEEKRNELILNNINNYKLLSKEYNENKKKILENLSKNEENKIDIVSGKHFLIHILYKILKKYSTSQLSMDSFKLRLSKHFNPQILTKLKLAIEETARGKIYRA